MIPLSDGYVTTTWLARWETIEACAERLRKCLLDLQNINPVFSNWLNIQRKGKLEVKPDVVMLTELLLAGMNRDEFPPRQPIPDLGFHVAFKKQLHVDYDILFNVNCGVYSTQLPLPNQCYLQFAALGDLTYKSLPMDLKMKALLVLIEAWQPEWGAICPNQLHKKVKEAHGVDLRRFCGWITYVSDKRGPLPQEITKNYLVTRIADGSLIHVSEEDYDEKNEGQVNASAQMGRILEENGIVPPRRRRGRIFFQ
jgi:hypothetical protein